ncbi:hypothetical protein MKW94_010622 [Papaver nudicaule]|uniref:Uncharacterized protein n=1 Tax=Papaver nudicaule TaxID=74823 RepID=A0AA41RX82_PAPNU|nr:hypothetical protein [Papaver nudicaule]
MGRPPCCDKVGIKKGPWTPEEDIILVSYIQQNGPGNWRSVPTNTGLMRCSKSCRLRWTNYLRPGIKRGNFTPHEEGMIIHLQSLLGNKWAAIASYLPQRTDNDIKNYWNTHLKKKINKFQSALNPPPAPPFHQLIASNSTIFATHRHHDLCYSDRTDNQSSTNSSLLLDHHVMINHATTTSSTGGSTYASSTENISRLLEGWMRSSPPKTNSNKIYILPTTITPLESNKEQETASDLQHHQQQSCDIISTSHEDFDSLLSFDETMNCNIPWEKLSSSIDNIDLDEKMRSFSEITGIQRLMENSQQHQQQQQQPFRLFEKWLLDEAAIHQGIVELSSMNDHSFGHDM